MKAVGEIMAIGRTFEEAFGKAMRSLEDGHQGICAGGKEGADKLSDDELAQAVATPTEHRIFFVVEALRRGWDIARIHAICGIDPWYLNRINDMVQVRRASAACVWRTLMPTRCACSSSTARAMPRSPR